MFSVIKVDSVSFSYRLSVLSFGLLGALGLWLGTANPFIHIPWLIFFYPMVLTWFGCTATSWKDALRIGWLCGAVGASAALYWIAVPVHVFGMAPWFLAVPCAVALGMYVGLYGGLFSVFVYCVRGLSVWRTVFVLGLFWYLLEWVRGWFLTGFPWLTLTAGIAPYTVLIQGAALIGAYALSGFYAGLVAWPVLMFYRRYMLRQECWPVARVVCFVGIVFALVIGSGYIVLSIKKTEPQRMVSLALIQGNIAQDIKWTSAVRTQLVERHIELSRKALQAFEDRVAVGTEKQKPRLLIWPESALPFDFLYSSTLRDTVLDFAAKEGIELLVGAIGFDEAEQKPFNRAYLVDSTPQIVTWYDKEHLVPFGEYTPQWLNVPFLEPLLQGVGVFLEGRRVEPIQHTVHDELVSGVLICYESLFPELARERVAQGATILTSMNNEAWFGQTSAAEQLLHLSLLRAVEQRRWLVRSTNNVGTSGLTAFVDPWGRVVARGGHERAFFLLHTVEPIDEHTYFFIIGSWLPFLACFVLLIVLWPLLRVCFLCWCQRMR